MKKTSPYRAKLIAATTCLLAISPFAPALAAPNDPTNPMGAVVEAIRDLKDTVILEMGPPDKGSIKEQLNHLFLDAFNGAFKFTAGAQSTKGPLDPVTTDYKFATPDTDQTAAPVPAYDFVRNASAQSATEKLKVSLSNKDAGALIKNLITPPPGTAKDDITGMLDAQNFLGPLVYNDTTLNKAERTLAFLSDYASPLGAINMTKLEEKMKPQGELADDDTAKAYLVKTYTNATVRSLLLGNLYDSLNARKSIGNLGTQSGMPNKADASIAEVEKYTASRRVRDPKWYEAMDTAPSAVVQRETAFILADIEWELYQLRMSNEKMLQTMTAAAMINLRMSAGMTNKTDIDLEARVEGRTTSTPPNMDEAFTQKSTP